MLTGIIFILIAWFVKMPLWLSILITLYGLLRIYNWFKIAKDEDRGI